MVPTFRCDVLRLSLTLFLGLTFHAFLHADVIYLKNGKQILCDSTWEEGKQVKYSIHDGTIGIPKAMVSKIVKTSEPQPTPEIPKLLQQQTQNNSDVSKPTIQNLETRAFDDPSLKSKVSKMYVSLALNLVNKKDFPGALGKLSEGLQMGKEQNDHYESGPDLLHAEG